MKTLLSVFVMAGTLMGQAAATAPQRSTAPASVLIRTAAPEYSEEARKRKIQGTVIVDVAVRSNGTIADTNVIRKQGFGLDEKAIEAVRKWIYSPARDKNGRAVDGVARVQVEFRLK
jgi:TonB family protein